MTECPHCKGQIIGTGDSRACLQCGRDDAEPVEIERREAKPEKIRKNLERVMERRH